MHPSFYKTLRYTAVTTNWNCYRKENRWPSIHPSIQETSKGRDPGSVLIRCSNHQKSSSSTPSSSSVLSATPLEVTHFDCLYLRSHSSGHDPTLMTITGGWNLDWLKNWKMCKHQKISNKNKAEADGNVIVNVNVLNKFDQLIAEKLSSSGDHESTSWWGWRKSWGTTKVSRKISKNHEALYTNEWQSHY